MHHFHAVVSIDHAEATVFELAENDVTEHRIKATDRQGHIHHRAGAGGSGHAHDSKTFLTAIVDALKPSHEILILGHGSAKDELVSFIREHVPELATRVMGVQAIDHPSKGETLALARKFFKAQDRMTSQL